MGEKKVILAIDDNAFQLRVFMGILASRYDFRAVKAAPEALSFLKSNKVDLILLDVEMPDVSGFEFLIDIRKIPSYVAVPIIIVSGNTGEDFFNQARNSSASDVLTKPVDSNTLVNAIEKALAPNCCP
jgi:CheY-like chemotaxis protein